MAEEIRGHSRAAGRIGKMVRGKWRIDARLGEGATATVYAATHRNGHRVALKVLHPQFLRDEQIRTRFMREAYVGNAIVHPGVVRVLDDDVTEDGAVFLVMELLEGESYETRCDRYGGRLPLAEVVWLLDALLDVLSAAHKKNIVHRDVKPDNLFLTRDGRVKVLDFGFARMKEQIGRSSSGEATTSLTKTGFILGTPDFMSPEQAGGRNSDVDGRSDLWSAAATAFYLISGERVHHGALTLHQHLLVTATARARSLGQAARDLPAPLVELIDRALLLEIDRRWPDADTMRAALHDAVGSLASPPPPLVNRGGKAVEDPHAQHSDLEETVVVNSSRRPSLAPDTQRDGRFDESVIFVGADGAGPPPSTRRAPAAAADAREALVAHAPATPRVSPAPRKPGPRVAAAPPPARASLPELHKQPVPLLVAPDADALTRAPDYHSSRSSITAHRIRPSRYAPYFSRWIFFLVIATICAVIFIVGLTRKKHGGQRHPVSFSAQSIDRTPPPTPAATQSAPRK